MSTWFGFRFFMIVGAFLSLLSMGSAQAGLVAQATRIVFANDRNEVTLRVRNTAAVPLLAQAWVDDGRQDIAPEDMNVPFSVTPAVSRVDPDKGIVLRIEYLGQPLPSDRESVFWLNILEVPPRDKDDNNAVQFSFRSRLKLFFRPPKFKDVSAAPSKLHWRIDSAAGTRALVVTNPTPYHVSFTSIVFSRDGKPVLKKGNPVSVGKGMIEPFSDKKFELHDPVDSQVDSVSFEIINDYGGLQVFNASLGK
ncbi:MAG: putative fimbrial chaperone YadV [Pseudomonas sp.]|nr:MAG: putative fimbrial chaperone YadV [Pseudomonas sp.]